VPARCTQFSDRPAGVVEVNATVRQAGCVGKVGHSVPRAGVHQPPTTSHVTSTLSQNTSRVADQARERGRRRRIRPLPDLTPSNPFRTNAAPGRPPGLR
jgi:hypothetical protein